MKALQEILRATQSSALPLTSVHPAPLQGPLERLQGGESHLVLYRIGRFTVFGESPTKNYPPIAYCLPSPRISDSNCWWDKTQSTIIRVPNRVWGQFCRSLIMYTKASNKYALRNMVQSEPAMVDIIQGPLVQVWKPCIVKNPVYILFF